MSQPQIAPYGTWKSPITPDLIVSGTVTLNEISLQGDKVYWLEARPTEGGRTVVVRRNADGSTTDLVPPPFYARTRVHEYGGGSYLVTDEAVYFANFADQRWYKVGGDDAPQPISPESGLRYADMVLDKSRNRLIGVREDHTKPDSEAVNTVVALALDGSDNGGTILASGYDFFADPRLSPDGTKLCWLTWNHPNMPWDGTELFVAEVHDDGGLGQPELVAGGLAESIFQPQWSPDGVLHFISDRTGWWNLYRWQDGEAEALCPMEAEFGLPHWVFGMSTYAFSGPTEIICTYKHSGRFHLARLDTNTKQLSNIQTPYTEITGIKANSQYVAFIGGSPSTAPAIVRLTLATGATEVLRSASSLQIDPQYLATPQLIEFPTANNQTAFGLFYPPTNADFIAPEGELPPLLVKSHGGPTSQTTSSLNLSIQYWASRGIAVLDVDYGGSTGYGREYRERLKGQWGVVDVVDCINGAKFLARQKLVDGQRLAIDGGSAGGYTTLCALTFYDDFKAGASYFGVSDVERLALDTHKFESRYMDSLVGPYPAAQDLYRQRSPIYHTDKLNCPMILLQGSEDKVVPPDQAEKMYEAVKAKGLPVAYILYEGEQHGFRQAKNIKRSLEAELYFYSQIFGFGLADAIEPVAIENWTTR